MLLRCMLHYILLISHALFSYLSYTYVYIFFVACFGSSWAKWLECIDAYVLYVCRDDSPELLTNAIHSVDCPSASSDHSVRVRCLFVFEHTKYLRIFDTRTESLCNHGWLNGEDVYKCTAHSLFVLYMTQDVMTQCNGVRGGAGGGAEIIRNWWIVGVGGSSSSQLLAARQRAAGDFSRRDSIHITYLNVSYNLRSGFLFDFILMCVPYCVVNQIRVKIHTFKTIPPW